MHVWFHSRKIRGVNPAYCCRYEALYFIGCYPKTFLKHVFYFLSHQHLLYFYRISQCGSSVISLYLWLQWCSSVFQLCKLSLDCHWHTTSLGASISQCGSSGIPVYLYLQWYSSMFQLFKWWALVCHWVIASSSVVPVLSAQWYPSVLKASALEVIRSSHMSACRHMYTTCMARVLLAKLLLFELQPRIHKTILVPRYKACWEWCWNTHMYEKQNWYAL